ncbi:Short-chain dehydrogenase TIC 32, chloroplastic [Cytospora mali]|uniref:Short-chain dehydrogenase TIC 32, chloroplastic n=1 Tax=Cytospora mali TaxID=578113 RepID=A0A194V9I4_CYTMA|nr:Short-chain dehydrogenase TIC 32, chloroplastic [Valsa mali var. pyri (nom. inval.)]
MDDVMPWILPIKLLARVGACRRPTAAPVTTETANLAAPKGTVVLTGANGGHGVAIVKKLVSRPDLTALQGIYAVRDVSSAPALQSALQDAVRSHPQDVVSLDLTRLEDVHKLAADINSRVAVGEIPPTRALILSAAYLEFEEQTWTEDGFDIAFASAYLGHWLLTMLLLQSMDRELGRILVIGISAHDFQDKRNNAGGQYKGDKWQTISHDSTEPIAKGTWSTSNDDPLLRGGYRRYGAAKLCQVMMVPELQHRIDTDPVLKNISVLAIDPGSTPTHLVRRGDWKVRSLWTYIMPLLPLLNAHATPTLDSEYYILNMPKTY